MRTLAAMACFSFAALSACTPNIVDGRILCASTAPLCPDGFYCVSDRCYRNTSDASVIIDAARDAAMSDQDVFEQSEICTPSRMRDTAREDEDSDGAIDEGCAFESDIVHPLTDALPRVVLASRDASVRFPRLSADGLTLTFCRMERLEEEVWQSTRSTVASRFGPSVRVPFASMARACAAQPIRDGYVFEGMRSTTSPRRIFTFRTGNSNPEEITNAVSTATAAGASGHPFLTADGLQLFFEGNRRIEGGTTQSDGLFVTTRPSRDSTFPFAEPVVFSGAAPTPLRDMFPTLSEDGLTLFFVRVLATSETVPMVATRRSTESLEFSAPQQVRGLSDTPLGSFAPSLSTWEVFVSSAAPTATAGRLTTAQQNEGLFHARLCAGACPARDANNLLACEGVASGDGLHCYTTSGAPMTYDAAVVHCADVAAPRRDALASVHSVYELGLVHALPMTSSVWIGARKATDGWAWSSGEPDTDNPGAPVYWAPTHPSDGACVSLNASGLGVSTACTELRVPACEADLWPTW